MEQFPHSSSRSSRRTSDEQAPHERSRVKRRTPEPRHAAGSHHTPANKGAHASSSAKEQAPARPKSRYIPALDGLRTLAVVAVVLYHLNLTWAQGGLLGAPTSCRRCCSLTTGGRLPRTFRTLTPWATPRRSRIFGRSPSRSSSIWFGRRCCSPWYPCI